MTEPEFTPETDLPPEDDIAALTAESDRRRREGRADDAAAMQAAVCLILAIALILLNTVHPDIAGALYDHLRDHTTATAEVMPNPIDLLADHIAGA